MDFEDGEIAELLSLGDLVQIVEEVAAKYPDVMQNVLQTLYDQEAFVQRQESLKEFYERRREIQRRHGGIQRSRAFPTGQRTDQTPQDDADR